MLTFPVGATPPGESEKGVKRLMFNVKRFTPFSFTLFFLSNHPQVCVFEIVRIF